MLGFGWGLSRFGCTWKCLEVPPNPSKMGENAQHRGVPCRSAQQASPAQIRASATTSAPRAPHFGCLCGVCQSRPVDCPSGRNFGRGLGEFLGVWMGFASVWVHVGGVWKRTQTRRKWAEHHTAGVLRTEALSSRSRHRFGRARPRARCAHQTSGVCVAFVGPGQWTARLGETLAGVWVSLPGFGWGLSRFG